MTNCLIIDDDATLRRMACDILTAHGLSVREAATAEEGLALFRRETADIVLLDLVLPDGSGYDLIPALTQNGRNCRVIATTSYFSLDSALQVLREGAGDYLPKPFSEETLMMSVERVQKRLSLEHENRELSTLLQRKLDDLTVLHRISGLITSNKPLETWMDEVMRAACSYIGAQAGSLLLLDSGTDELVFFVTTGPKGDAVHEVRLPRGHGVAWWCLENREAVKVDDTRTDDRFDSSIDDRSGFITRSVLAVPVIVREDCIGVIELLNKNGRRQFEDDDLRRLKALSSHIAVAVQNAMVIRDLTKSREELARWSRQLEQIVEQRTRALKDAHHARQIGYQDLEHTHQQLKRAQSALVEREKMAAIGLLSAGVAHEINNPLGFVNANLSTLEQYVRSLRRLAGVMTHAMERSGVENSDLVVRLVNEARRVITEEKLSEVIDDLGPLFEEMHNGLTRITSIVEQLRSFAEDGSSCNSDERVDLNAEVSRLANLVSGTAREGSSIHFEPGQVSTIRVSLGNLRQVLLNLMSPSTLNAGATRRLQVRTGSQNGTVFLQVVNLDAVCTDGDIGKIFDPFFGPGEEQPIGGLGLSAAYGLARSMGGTLKAFRSGGGGVGIQFSLPADGSCLAVDKEAAS